MFINRRYKNQTGVLTGLGLAACGAFLFYPTNLVMTYDFFSLPLFVLAAGLVLANLGGH